MEFPVFVPIAFCSSAGYHCEESGSAFFTLNCSPQLFIHIEMIPLNLLFSSLNSPFSLSSCDRYSSPLVFFVALRWTCTSISMSLLYWGIQNWT